MREAVLPTTYIQQRSSAAAIERKNCESRWTLILSASVLTAFAFAGAGLIASALAGFDLVERAELFSRAGALLLVASAPLFFLSAHCLDKIRFEEKRLKKMIYSTDFRKN